MKKREGAKSQIIDELMRLTGLEDIKLKFMETYDTVTLDKQRGANFKKKRYNVRLEGNPGTGKTTVAKLYGRLLKELGVLSAVNIQETSGAKLIDERVEGLKKQLDTIEKEGGGILFIDEAYQLDPKNDRDGKQILNYLLEVMETKIGTLVVAVAGYKKEMEKLLEFNPGLESRFPHRFQFADYTDEELLSIFQGLMSADGKSFHFRDNDVKYARIAVRRLGRMRGKDGFGNARAVQNVYDAILRRQTTRLLAEKKQGKNPDLFELQREDILGPPPSQVEETSAAWRELKNMIGLEKVKQSIYNLFELVKTNCMLEEEEKPLRQIALNRLFLGNPGTGKTTVAALYAKILGELGLLSKGEVVLKTASDFIGSVLGASEENTKKILESAIGSVLVIDEAYGLYSDNGIGNSSDPYKTAVINTIVEQVQNVPGEDRCVIMLGYKEDMQRMIKNSNQGLSRRFQIEDAFEFEDYNDEQLLQILELKMKKRGLTASLDAKVAGVEVLAKQRKLPNFGNGGAVENLLSRAVLKMQKRSNKSSQLIEEDLAEPIEELSDQSLFGDLVGCQNIIEVLKEYRDTINAAKLKGKDAVAEGLLELNFRFVGSPGTGKTTVASRMGKMFHSLGVLAYPEVVAKSASDLSPGYVGQTGKATRQIMEQALGKVLFIDEAYRLNPAVGGSFMQEALDELVQLLTEPKFKGKLVVILAGYEADMDRLMNVNAGLRSRFSKVLKFRDLGVEDACMLMKKELQKMELTLSKEGEGILPTLMKQLVERPGFSNGRDINTWSNRIFRYWASVRPTATTDEVTPAILENSLKLLLEDSQKEVTQQPLRPKLPTASANANPSQFTMNTNSKKEVAEKKNEYDDGDNNNNNKSDLDLRIPGLTDQELQAMNDVAVELDLMGTDTDPDRLLKQVINADIKSPTMKQYVLKVAQKLGNPNTKEVEEKVTKMQEGTKENLQKIERVKTIALQRKYREVWKCAACGRFVPQCTFRPYRAYTEEIM